MMQWRVGQLNPPHLKAMIPWEGVSDLYREWAFRGGIPETRFCPFLDGLIKRTWPGCELDELAVGQREHPFLDDYWQARHGNLADIRVPLYVCASWSTQGLHNRGTIEGYRQASSQYKWIEIHGRKEWEVYFSREALERQLRFCDYFLKGIENDWLDTPRVRYELRERFYDGPTKFADAWPLAAHATPGLLPGHGEPADAARRGAATVPAGDLQLDRAQYDDGPRHVHAALRSGYRADRLHEAQAVGLCRNRRRPRSLRRPAQARPARREMHFPDFNHIENGLVARGWLRVSHRELDEARSTPASPG